MKKAILIWFFGTVCSLYAGTNQIQIVSGNGQETRLVKPRLTSDRTSGEARFRPIVVRLLDKEGRGIEGKKIQFSASGPAGMSIQTMGTTIPITNAAGEATLPGILCFHTIGKVKVTVSAENAAAAIVELEVLLPADELPAEKIHLLFLSGNEQRVEILQHADGVGADFKPIRVQIRESSGKPAPFVFVTFSAPAGLQINREIRSNTAIVRADAEGIAELNMLGNRSASTKMSGNYTIQVTMGKASGSITLEAIARLRPNANHLEIVSGNNQKIRLADLAMAREVQESLLKRKGPGYPGLVIVEKYIPFSEVGGDIYDIREIAPGKVRIFVADANGHGVQAALITVMIKSEYDSLNQAHLRPAEIVESFNRSYTDSRRSYVSMFSCFILDLDFERRTIEYSSGGHPAQMLLRSGEILRLKPGGPMIGIKGNARFGHGELPLLPGDRFLIFTDGIFEEFNERKEIFGEERLWASVGALSHQGMSELTVSLLAEVQSFLGNAKWDDDTTILGIEVRIPET